jgi:hypothetical protein
VSSRWVWTGADSKSPKVPNPDFHPPILFHYDPQTGDAYFSDEAGIMLDPDTVPQYIRDDVTNNPMQVRPQIAPPNIRPASVDPVTGQEFQAGQDIKRDVMQGVPLLNETRTSDVVASQNRSLMQQNKMLLERLEALEKAKAAPKKPRKKAKSKSQAKRLKAQGVEVINDPA